MECEDKNKSLFELFKDLLTLDTNGDAAIRVVVGEDTGVSFIDCEKKSYTDDEISKSLITQDCNGKPALNLAAFPCP